MNYRQQHIKEKLQQQKENDPRYCFGLLMKTITIAVLAVSAYWLLIFYILLNAL